MPAFTDRFGARFDGSATARGACLLHSCKHWLNIDCQSPNSEDGIRRISQPASIVFVRFLERE
jgi:hypothetical protein